MAFEFTLAGTAPPLADLKFPIYASPKIDGVRGGVRGGKLLARSLKLIPNRYTQKLFGRFAYDGLDGELAVGLVTAPDVFNKTSGAMMRGDGEPNVSLNVFDITTQGEYTPFHTRIERALRVINNSGAQGNSVRLIEHTLIRSVNELQAFERKMLNAGYEGLVLRDPEGLRKNGRSTTREAILLRLVREVRGEAVIIGVEEGMENTNAKTLESKGRAKRSSHKAGKVPNGMLGAFLVRDLASGIEFSLGTGQGLTIGLRQTLWGARNHIIGKIVMYEAKATGAKLKPRQPIWIGFRDKRDMGKQK